MVRAAGRAAVSHNIRALRKAKSLSRRLVARRAGISANTLKGLENGSQPDLGTVLRLQVGLELASIELLLGGLETFPSEELVDPPDVSDASSA